MLNRGQTMSNWLSRLRWIFARRCAAERRVDITLINRSRSMVICATTADDCVVAHSENAGCGVTSERGPALVTGGSNV